MILGCMQNDEDGTIRVVVSVDREDVINLAAGGLVVVPFSDFVNDTIPEASLPAIELGVIYAKDEPERESVEQPG